jgi:prepilin-type N-terminal cleavage/methylation domain-containing protein/prepilin-type processing-associated H-X9-DG protein
MTKYKVTLGRSEDLDSRIRRQGRRAFTLLEVLTVLAILAALLGLLLPAVQRAREAADRLRCAHNLRQLGLALHQFAGDRGAFPPGAVYGPFPETGVTTDAAHGCWPFLLPYLEQQGLADRYRWDVDFFDPANQPAVATPLKVLQCPAAADRVVAAGQGDGVFTDGRVGACADYSPVASVSPGLAALGLIDPPLKYQGALPVNARVRPVEISDGTSSTLLVAEDAGRPQLWRAGRSVPGLFGYGGPWASAVNPVVILGSSADGSAVPGSCALNCTNNRQPYSFHPGGCNFLFADGAVHVLRAGMDIRVLAALATRAGGEAVPAGDW